MIFDLGVRFVGHKDLGVRSLSKSQSNLIRRQGCRKSPFFQICRLPGAAAVAASKVTAAECLQCGALTCEAHQLLAYLLNITC